MSIDGEVRRQVGVHFDGDLRRALIEAAVSEIEAAGIDRLSLRQVARRIGVSHAAPAHHFGDKAGLLTAVATEGFTVFSAHLAAARRPEADAGEQLAELGRAYASFAAQHPGAFDVMFRPSILRSDESAYLTASSAAYGTLRQVIEACQGQGWRAKEDTAALTTAMWGLIHGLCVLRHSDALATRGAAPAIEDIVSIAATLITP